MNENITDLENKLAHLETEQNNISNDIATIRNEINAIKRKQTREGPLAPLAEALTFHHKRVNRWDYLVLEGDKPENASRLYIEFCHMREVVIHYEYVTQQLLGIQPSPLANLEDNL